MSAVNNISPERRLGCGNLHLDINYTTKELNSETLVRIKPTAGRGGSCVRHTTEALGRIITVAIEDSRDKTSTLKKIIRELKGISCSKVENISPDKKKHKLSCADGIARVLDEYLFPIKETTGEVSK